MVNKNKTTAHTKTNLFVFMKEIILGFYMVGQCCSHDVHRDDARQKYRQQRFQLQTGHKCSGKQWVHLESRLELFYRRMRNSVGKKKCRRLNSSHSKKLLCEITIIFTFPALIFAL